MPHILVINPNSSETMTRAIDAELDALRFAGGPTIASISLRGAPAAIESQLDVERVVLPLADTIKRERADAYVIACFSDPGLALARERTDRAVVGIAESAFLAAIGLGRSFGIVAIAERSIPRHIRAVAALGLSSHLAGDIAINTGVAGLSDRKEAVERIVGAGRRLRDERGAGVLVLGCAGMGRYRAEIEGLVGLPVVDPTQVAVARAIGYAALGLRPAL